MTFIWPFPRDDINFTSYYGHSGIDWPGAAVGGAGTPVVAVGPGTVVGRTVNSVNDPGDFSEPTWRGNSITIDHGTIGGIGITSLYTHMLNAPAVDLGDPVDAGTLIGQIGNSGSSTGAHLHFEIIYNGDRLETDTPGNNTPGLGFTRTLDWMDANVGTTTPGPGTGGRRARRRNGWLNRPPTIGYRTW